MRERRVLGCTARTSAAPPGPLILHAQRSSTARTCSRAIASKLWSEPGPGRGGHGRWLRHGTGRPARRVQRVVQPQRLARREDERPLEHVLELPHVARPVVGDERVHHAPGDLLDAPAQVLLSPLDEGPGDQRDVLPPLAQGRDLDREDAQAVVEVAPEAPLRHRALEVAGWWRPRGARPPCAARVAPRRCDLAVLQHAQQLRLQLQREVADLVEEERPAVGQLEAAGVRGDRAGEGALLVAEELALDAASRAGRRS